MVLGGKKRSIRDCGLLSDVSQGLTEKKFLASFESNILPFVFLKRLNVLLEAWKKKL